MLKNLIKIFHILLRSDIRKSSILIVSVFSLCTILFEVIGIGIFIPIINLFKNPSIELSFFNWTINFNSTEDTIKFIAFGLISVFTLKSLNNIFHSYLLAKFWSEINEKLTIKYFKSILSQSLIDFYRKTYTSHSNFLVIEIEKFSELCKYAISFLVELFILIILILLIIFYDFKSSILTLSIIIIFGFILFMFFKERLINWGSQRQLYQDKFQNEVKSGVSSFLTIIINGGLNYFTKNIYESLSTRNSYIKRQFVFESIPKNLIELFGLFIIIFSTYILYYFFYYDSDQITSYIILMIITFSRILPSINRLITSFNIINFSKSVVDLILSYDEISISKKIKNKNSNYHKSIKFVSVGFGYNGEKKVLNNISFEFKKGEILGLFGESGSGKTTLVKLIMLLLKPTEGKIFIDDKLYEEVDSKSFQNLFGYVEQNVKLFNASLIENITLGEKYHSDWMKFLIKTCQLDEIWNIVGDNKILEDGINLSGGQIQRVGLARAIFKKPKILILDEFTSALDDLNKIKILEALKKFINRYELSVVFISHDDELRKFSDKIINL